MQWARKKKGGTVDNTKSRFFTLYHTGTHHTDIPPLPPLPFFPINQTLSFEPSSSSTVAFVLIRYRSLSISPTLTRSLSCLVLLFCPVFVCLVACFLLPPPPPALTGTCSSSVRAVRALHRCTFYFIFLLHHHPRYLRSLPITRD